MSNKHAEIVRSLNKQWKKLPACLEIPKIVYPKHPTAELIKSLIFTWNGRHLGVKCKRPTTFLVSTLHEYINPETGFGQTGWEHMRVAYLPFRNSFKI